MMRKLLVAAAAVTVLGLVATEGVAVAQPEGGDNQPPNQSGLCTSSQSVSGGSPAIAGPLPGWFCPKS